MHIFICHVDFYLQLYLNKAGEKKLWLNDLYGHF